MGNKQNKSVDDFWREYEEKIGEKVLAKSLGQYLSGWDEFDSAGWRPLWGLVIAAEGGFRFHHFPQASWLDLLKNFGPGKETPREKTFFIPGDRILSAELRRETRWWKRILGSSMPVLVINYRNKTEGKGELFVQIEYKTEGIVESLTRQTISSTDQCTSADTV
ncbi:MAG: hypothetical protein LBS57_04350 [Treponema sp.]|jgi:hypothetical protein|nr:hypothetical protein [Treponema sp.]